MRTLIPFATLVLYASLAWGQNTPAAPPKSTGRWQDVSLEDYRKHLVTLTALTRACANGRDLKTCDPMLVGLDDRVPLGNGSERRLIRYGWLRVLFSRAEEPDEAQKAPESGSQAKTEDSGVRSRPQTTSQLLQDAEARLMHDLEQADAMTSSEPQHAAERATLQQVLAGSEFRNLKQQDAREDFLERLSRWLNHFFERFGKLRAHSAWVGRALIWGFLLLVGVALTWALLQVERRWRMRLLPDSDATALEAASARDWQLWVTDARQAAAAGRWREAIHFLYWASISRLESKRLWPADRARTPREYLALLPDDDPRKATLGALTHSFEHTWYGGRAPNESEYRRAEELASALIAGSASAAEHAHSSGNIAAEGSAP